MPDKCDKIRKEVAGLEDKLAELRAEIVGATGSVQHSLAGQINAALHDLDRARRALADCEHIVPGPPPPPPDTTTRFRRHGAA